jgi:hypothetical protein
MDRSERWNHLCHFALTGLLLPSNTRSRRRGRGESRWGSHFLGWLGLGHIHVEFLEPILFKNPCKSRIGNEHRAMPAVAAGLRNADRVQGGAERGFGEKRDCLSHGLPEQDLRALVLVKAQRTTGEILVVMSVNVVAEKLPNLFRPLASLLD